MSTCQVCAADLIKDARFCEMCGSPDLAQGAGSNTEFGVSESTVIPSTDSCQQTPYQQGPYQQGPTGYLLANPGYTGEWPQPGMTPRPPEHSYASSNTHVSAFGEPLASWPGRVGAMLIDGIILGIPLGIFTVSYFGALMRVRLVLRNHQYVYIKSLTVGQELMWLVIVFLAACLYFALLNSSTRGQTLGNAAIDIAVCDAVTGHPIGRWRGVARSVVRIALYAAFIVPGLINDLMPLWDSRRQTVADKAVRSVMVKV